MKLKCSLLFVVAALVALADGLADAQSASQAAAQLVSLTKPEERQIQAIRFMLAAAPMALPETLGDCMIAKGTPAFRAYFTSLYAAQLTEAELRQAVDFFRSEEGQAAVALRIQHEQKVFDAALKGEPGIKEEPEYPPKIQRACRSLALLHREEIPSGKD